MSRPLFDKLPAYAPELVPAGTVTARALMRVFARYMELLDAGLAEVPGRSFLAFLEMLNTELLPAQAARAPLVFELIEGSPADVTLLEHTQVAAAASASEPVVFATDQSITLCRSRIAALYSISPGRDEYADHSARLTEGFTLFDDLRPIEHALYLGHDQLFALSGDMTLLLYFTLETGAATALVTEWEYLTDTGWLPFASLPQDDTTNGLRSDGQIALRRACGPDAAQAPYAGRTSYWVRGRLTNPLVPSATARQPVLPVINDIRASVMFSKAGLLPEAAFADGTRLDTTKAFFPFGSQPAPFATFYVASREVFQRKGAQIVLTLSLAQNGGPSTATGGAVTLQMIWEFHDGSAWRPLSIDADAKISLLAASGTVTFLCPAEWAETSVNGVANFWLRLRIGAGDYGQPLRLKVNTDHSFTPEASSLQPPVVATLALKYAYVTDPEPLDHCLSYNDFLFADHSEDCRWPDRVFTPFQALADRDSAVHFGFDRPLPSGLVSLYVDIADSVDDATASSFLWEYRSSRGWNELAVLDETVGLRRSGMVQFVGPPDAIAVEGLGGKLYRVRARLAPGRQETATAIGGVWRNAAWATHRSVFEREALGMSDGNPRQSFSARHTPVLVGESLFVQEWVGRGEHWKTFVQNVPDEDLRFERDPADDAITAVWVLWHARPHLHDSQPQSRHYLIERARGLVRFGDGRYGMIPPAGRRIALSYRSGGGLDGNLPANTLTQLRSAVPFAASVANPVAASGGAATETLAAVQRRGPQRLRHSDRAISAADCEWLALEASPEIARARCLSVTGPAGRAQRGWITLAIVPHSAAPRPSASAELKNRVQQHLAARVPATVATRIRLADARYVPVSVTAEIVFLPGQVAAALESSIRERLDAFLHPLTGSASGGGWSFGESLHLSQIASALQGTPGLDFVRSIRLSVADRFYANTVAIDPDELLAPGTHQLTLLPTG